MPPIRVAALALLRRSASGEELLLVRKQGTRAFMLPGGKFEPGESVRACLARELREELSLDLAADATPLGRFEAPAANEPDTRVEAEIFAQAHAGPGPEPAAEIAEIRWWPLSDAADALPLAPLVADGLLGRLRAGNAARHAPGAP